MKTLAETVNCGSLDPCMRTFMPWQDVDDVARCVCRHPWHDETPCPFDDLSSTGSSDGGNPAGHRDAAGDTAALTGGRQEKAQGQSIQLGVDCSDDVPAGASHSGRRPEFADPDEEL